MVPKKLFSVNVSLTNEGFPGYSSVPISSMHSCAHQMTAELKVAFVVSSKHLSLLSLFWLAGSNSGWHFGTL